MPMAREAGNGSVPAMIAQRYGLKVRRMTAHRSLYRANAAYRVVTDQGVYVLKPFRRFYARVLRGYRHVEQLERAGYAHMPHWLRAQGGQPVVRWRNVHYYMVDWVEGEKLAATEAEMEQLGRVLGRLHAVSGKLLAGTHGSDYTVRYMHKISQLQRAFRLRLPLLVRRTDPAGRWFRRHGKRSLALFEEALRMLRQPEAKAVLDGEPLQPAIIHGDVTRPNVIRRKERMYMIDWDRARKGSIYWELDMALANVTHFSIPLIRALLHGYEEQRPLRPAERQVVAALFRLPTEVWQAARQVALGRGRHPLYLTVVKTWADRIAAIAWLDRWAARGAAEPPAAATEPPAEAQPLGEVSQPLGEASQPLGEAPPQGGTLPAPEVPPPGEAQPPAPEASPPVEASPELPAALEVPPPAPPSPEP